MWNKTFLILWAALVAAPVTYEIYAAFHNNVVPTLTDVVSKYFPWWVTMPVLTVSFTWIWCHFAVQYKYPDWLIKKILQG